MAKEKKSKHIKRYLISIMEDGTHKNILSISSSRFSFIASIIGIFLILSAIILLIISFSPLKMLIPGYTAEEVRLEARQNAARLDSLERITRLWSLQLINIQRVVNAQEPLDIQNIVQEKEVEAPIDSLIRQYSKGDSLIRQEILNYEKFNLSQKETDELKQIQGLLFFPPLTGIITQEYNKGIGHPYVDIAAATGTVVSAVLDGTVIAADWSDKTGFTMQIQHQNNLISVYKHNAKLFKKAGDKVKAGTPIAVIGENGGSLSTGPHLHFELWHKGEPINPSLYIKF